MEFLSHHHESAYAPRIQSTHLKASLAHAALKSIPGAAQLIHKTFSVGTVPKEIKPNKIENLVMHTGFIEN